MSRWEAERRLDYIEDVLIAKGRVNRLDLCTMFDISIPQASVDLGRYAALNPGVSYDMRDKAYRWKEKPSPVRGSSVQRRKAWAIF